MPETNEDLSFAQFIDKNPIVLLVLAFAGLMWLGIIAAPFIILIRWVTGTL